MKYVSRSEWGATSRGATTSSHPIGSTLGVTLHWEGPHMGAFDHSRCAEKVRGIQRFHKEDRGWADIAYNFVVCPHGYVFEGRGVGVTSAANGDTKPNDDWYAVCYLGGEGDGFTGDGKQGMRAAVRHLRAHGAGPLVNGHRDHKSTTCPGDEIYRWLHAEDFDLPARHDLKPEENDMPEARDFLNEPLNKHEPKGRPATRGLTVGESLSLIPIIAKQIGGEAAAVLEQMQSSPVKKES